MMRTGFKAFLAMLGALALSSTVAHAKAAQEVAESETAAAAAATAPASSPDPQAEHDAPSDEDKDAQVATLLRMMSGQSAMDGEALDQALTNAAAYPLGSRENPVRASMPQGQRAYLARLRCSDVRAPDFAREGSVGVGPFGNIIDVYMVRCDGSDPAQTRIFMDMYHKGYAEARPVAGFGMAGD